MDKPIIFLNGFRHNETSLIRLYFKDNKEIKAKVEALPGFVLACNMIVTIFGIIRSRLKGLRKYLREWQ